MLSSRTSWRLITIVIAVLTLFACSDRPSTVTTPTTPTSPTPPTTSIPPPVRGTVVDFQTANPIAGAIVGFATSLGAGNDPIGMSQTAVTDANGQYSLPEPPVRTPPSDSYYLLVNNTFVGRGYLHGANKRAGDVAVHKGLCVTRYGMVLDRATYLPIVDAQILNLSNRVLDTTDRDGWYQYDFGCSTGSSGFNTTWLIATHPDYTPANFSGGRGFQGVVRDDVLLTRR